MRVRAAGARYGQPAVPEEPFPGSGVLQDLSLAPDREVPLILARYAALRAWALRVGPWEPGDPAEPAVVEHALSAARAHLAATAEHWPEAALLDRVLEGLAGAGLEPGRAGELTLLGDAARASEKLGHVHGARALREAAHRARWRAGAYPPASLS